MSGQELYELYIIANQDFGCVPDIWHDLSELERRIWEKLASSIQSALTARQLE
jgi:hypothetical protein